MRSRIYPSALLGELRLKLARHRLLRMFVAGGANTVFGFVVFSLLLLSGMATWAALLLGLVCGTLFNFVTTGSYVFRRQLSLGGYRRFLACYLLVYLINLGLVRLMFHATANDIISQAILSLPIALFSYFLMGRFVFAGPSSGNRERSTP